MAANLIAKYLWEVNALAQTRSGLSLEELNQQWVNSYLYDDKDIPRKTWWEHRQQIGIQFGINIDIINRPTAIIFSRKKKSTILPFKNGCSIILPLATCLCKVKACVIASCVSTYPQAMNISRKSFKPCARANA